MKKGNPKISEYFDLHKFASDVSQARSDRGFTQDEMASFLCIQRSTIVRYEDETHIPTPDYLFRFCRMLGLDPNDYRKKAIKAQENDCNEVTANEMPPAFDSESFRRDLLDARLGQNMLQDDIPRIYKIKRTAYGAIERTGKLSTEMLYKLCEIFHINDLKKYIKRQ